MKKFIAIFVMAFLGFVARPEWRFPHRLSPLFPKEAKHKSQPPRTSPPMQRRAGQKVSS